MKFTLKEIAEKVNVPVGTIRSWTLKPIEGEAYDPRKINYEKLRSGLAKYMDHAKFAEIFGCKIDEVEVVKGEKTNHNYIRCIDLEQNKKYIIHNYSMKTDAIFVGTYFDNDVALYIFKTEKKYKAYMAEELELDNIKIEEAEEE